MIRAIDCVIPAAGEASRFGRNKLLEPWNHSTVIEVVVHQAHRFFERIILVTGNDQERIRERFPESDRIVCIENRDFRDGMFSSIQTGIRLVDGDRFLVMMGDMPAVPDEIIKTILACKDHFWCRPRYGQRPGHPVLISARLIDELLALPRKTGRMRDVLMRYPGKEFLTTDIGVFQDIDTEDDYSKLKDLSGG